MSILAGMFVLTAAAVPTARPMSPDCASVRATLSWTGACVEGSGGIALAANDAEARTLLTEADAGVQRFRATFGRDAARYAVAIYDDPAQGGSMRQSLRQAGFPAVFVTPSPRLMAQQQAAAMQRFGAGGTPVRIVTRDPGGGGGGEPRDENHLPHELGHEWYRTAFWAGVAPPTTPSYGSAAPDWLDEAAAMLMETDTGKRRYHQIFADGRSTDPARAAAVPPEMPLAELTSMTHPMLRSMPVPGAATGPSQMFMGKPSLFYAESRVFADYLAERSGNLRILATISAGLRAGDTLDAWLRRDGAANGLPTSLAAMQADWDGWLDRRFGKAQAD